MLGRALGALPSAWWPTLHVVGALSEQVDLTVWILKLTVITLWYLTNYS